MSKNNKDFIEIFQDYSVHIPTRTVYLGSYPDGDDNESGIEYRLAENFIKNMHILESINKNPIYVIMNNFGGETDHGMAIYDTIKYAKSHVTVEGRGNVMSMATYILQAADERLLSPNSLFMIHEGTGGINETHSRNVLVWAKFYAQWGDKIDNILYEKMKEKNLSLSKKKFKDFMAFDKPMFAEDVIKLGLADRIKGYDE